MYRKEFDELVKEYNEDLDYVSEQYDSLQNEISNSAQDEMPIIDPVFAEKVRKDLDSLNRRYKELVGIFVEHNWKSYKIFPNKPPEYDYCYEKKFSEIAIINLSLEIEQFNITTLSISKLYNDIVTEEDFNKFNVDKIKYFEEYEKLDFKADVQHKAIEMYKIDIVLPELKLFRSDLSKEKLFIEPKIQEFNLKYGDQKAAYDSIKTKDDQAKFKDNWLVYKEEYEQLNNEVKLINNNADNSLISIDFFNYSSMKKTKLIYKKHPIIATSTTIIFVLFIGLFVILQNNCDINSTAKLCSNISAELAYEDDKNKELESLIDEATSLGLTVILDEYDTIEEQIAYVEQLIADENARLATILASLKTDATELGLDPQKVIGEETNISKQITLLETAIANEEERLEKSIEALEKEAIELGLNPREITKSAETLLEKEKLLTEAIAKEKEKISKEEAANSAPSSSGNSVSGDYTLVTASPCDTSGYRAPNAKVDIGFDSSYANREYYAYTNSHAQVTYVEADELIIQSDAAEAVNDDGRYCNDEAKVPGTESSELDEGHIIADSLGGVSNAYNITPQESTLNRSGEQADMEETIRSALESGKEVTNFYAEITYPNTSTQIPSHYYYSFYINGTFYEYSFDNTYTDESTPPPASSGGDEPQFGSCTEREENGYTDPIYEGDPEYDWYDDRDGDGIVCE